MSHGSRRQRPPTAHDPSIIPPLPHPADERWRAYLAGYERGILTGWLEGYIDGASVLDDAAAVLVALRRMPIHDIDLSWGES